MGSHKTSDAIVKLNPLETSSGDQSDVDSQGTSNNNTLQNSKQLPLLSNLLIGFKLILCMFDVVNLVQCTNTILPCLLLSTLVYHITGPTPAGYSL